MKRCADIQALLPAYVESELPGPAQQAVTDHLGGCAACRAEASAHRSALALLRAPRQPEAPGNLYAGFLAKLADSEARTVRSRARLQWATGAAFALLVGVVVVSSTNVFRGHVSPGITVAVTPAAPAVSPAPAPGRREARSIAPPRGVAATGSVDGKARVAAKTRSVRERRVAAVEAHHWAAARPAAPPSFAFKGGPAALKIARADIDAPPSRELAAGTLAYGRSDARKGAPVMWGSSDKFSANPAKTSITLANPAPEGLTQFDAAWAMTAPARQTPAAPTGEAGPPAGIQAYADMDALATAKDATALRDSKMGEATGAIERLTIQPECDDRVRVNGTETRISTATGWDEDGRLALVRVDAETVDLTDAGTAGEAR